MPWSRNTRPKLPQPSSATRSPSMQRCANGLRASAASGTVKGRWLAACSDTSQLCAMTFQSWATLAGLGEAAQTVGVAGLGGGAVVVRAVDDVDEVEAWQKAGGA